jgi:hypothetical protein
MVLPMISSALAISIVLAASALIAAYGLGALWLPAAGILVLAGLWFVGQQANWPWMSWLMVALFAGAAAFGALLELSPLPLVIGLIAALSAWDLGEFDRQLQRADAVEGEHVLKRRHLRRLLVVDGLGLLCAMVALAVQVRLSFGLALVLGLIALVGLSRAIRFLRRETG